MGIGAYAVESYAIKEAQIQSDQELLDTDDSSYTVALSDDSYNTLVVIEDESVALGVDDEVILMKNMRIVIVISLMALFGIVTAVVASIKENKN